MHGDRYRTKEHVVLKKTAPSPTTISDRKRLEGVKKVELVPESAEVEVDLTIRDGEKITRLAGKLRVL